MYIVIFCDKGNTFRAVSNKILLAISDYVNCRTKYNRSIFEIDEKDIIIDIRSDDILKAAGLRPDYVLFHQVSKSFIETWEYNMKGRYTEIKSLEELIQMVIKED